MPLGRCVLPEQDMFTAPFCIPGRRLYGQDSLNSTKLPRFHLPQSMGQAILFEEGPAVSCFEGRLSRPINGLKRCVDAVLCKRMHACNMKARRTNPNENTKTKHVFKNVRYGKTHMCAMQLPTTRNKEAYRIHPPKHAPVWALQAICSLGYI